MKRVLIAALAILTIAAGAAAADKPKASDKPNYSGEWKMNPTASNFGQFPPPNSFVRKIQHADPALNIVEDQAAGGAESTTARKMTTDGKPAALELNGYPAVCSAVWDGKDIVATTNMESAGVKFTDRMSLSPDGKTLTSKVQITSSQGGGDVTIVFDRQ
ncbi:MAG TPA: hypothetical protein VN891_09450 [Steroidobacteraceae bacterium]|jgi:hypothetical protein|nr:hypothetical protein [Steroidobacteraceae bacterium]